MDEARPGYYAVIPADVRYDDSIPANAKLLYGEISALIGADGFCFASNQYFAKLYGMSNETIARLLTKLEGAGHIRRVIQRDDSGQIIARKLYLKVSIPDGWGIDEKINTPLQKNQEGIDEKVKDTNTSITDIEKENKKEKAKALSDEQLQELFMAWIMGVSTFEWSRDVKNALYLALVGFYEPRASKKQEPARTKAAFTALANRLSRFSGGNPATMIDMLERATTAGWKSVYALNGSNSGSTQPEEGRPEEWL